MNKGVLTLYRPVWRMGPKMFCLAISKMTIFPGSFFWILLFNVPLGDIKEQNSKNWSEKAAIFEIRSLKILVSMKATGL